MDAQPFILDDKLIYKRVKDLDDPKKNKYEIGELYNNEFLKAKGIFNKKTKKMHGLVTFFKTQEVKFKKSVKDLIVVDYEGKFNRGIRKGFFRKYSYDFFKDMNKILEDSQFPNIIQEYFEIITSPITNKTL